MEFIKRADIDNLFYNIRSNEDIVIGIYEQILDLPFIELDEKDLKELGAE